jgi:hypothetical protein
LVVVESKALGGDLDPPVDNLGAMRSFLRKENSMFDEASQVVEEVSRGDDVGVRSFGHCSMLLQGFGRDGSENGGFDEGKLIGHELR